MHLCPLIQWLYKWTKGDRWGKTDEAYRSLAYCATYLSSALWVEGRQGPLVQAQPGLACRASSGEGTAGDDKSIVASLLESTPGGQSHIFNDGGRNGVVHCFLLQLPGVGSAWVMGTGEECALGVGQQLPQDGRDILVSQDGQYEPWR